MSAQKLPSVEDIRSSIQEENFLGAGSNGRVYNIDGYPEFVAKIRISGTTGVPASGTLPKIIDTSIYGGRNFGQAIAKYGPDVELLILQKGIPCGLSRHLVKKAANPQWYYEIRPTPQPTLAEIAAKKENDRIYENSIRIAANMPPESYVHLLEDIQFLNSINKVIDYSKSDNVLFDVPNNRFNLVDILDRDSGAINVPSHLLVMFIGLHYDPSSNRYEGENKTQIIANRQIIVERMIEASEKLGIPLTSGAKASDDTHVSRSLELAGYDKDSTARYEIEARIDNLLSKATPNQQQQLLNAATAERRLAQQSQLRQQSFRATSASDAASNRAPASSGSGAKTIDGPSQDWEALHGKAGGVLGVVPVVIDTTSALVQGDDKKAAITVGGFAGVTAGTKAAAMVAGRFGLAETIPVAGQAFGGAFAAIDSYNAATHGHIARASLSGIEATLYTTSAVAGAAAAFNFWNPAGWGAGGVALIAGTAAISITAGKAVYDNRAIIESWLHHSNQLNARTHPNPLGTNNVAASTEGPHTPATFRARAVLSRDI